MEGDFHHWQGHLHVIIFLKAAKVADKFSQFLALKKPSLLKERGFMRGEPLLEMR